METIGHRIKRLRESADVTQNYVASKVGVSRVAVTKWESGETSNLKLDNLMALCRLFGVSVEYLIYGDKAKDEKKPSKFISKRQLDIRDIAEDLNDPAIDEDDIRTTKSVINLIKSKKSNTPKNQTG